jgi:hypothetical protein
MCPVVDFSAAAKAATRIRLPECHWGFSPEVKVSAGAVMVDTEPWEVELPQAPLRFMVIFETPMNKVVEAPGFSQPLAVAGTVEV